MGRYTVLIDGTRRAIEIEDVLADDGKLRLVVDGTERALDVRDLGGGVWSILNGTAARLIQVDGTGPKMTVEVSHPDGEPRICLADVTDGRAPAAEVVATGAPVGALTLRAPIPGRVVKVLVKVGDSVKLGQTLLVLEAMKMENELRAPRAGVISAVHAHEGQAVETGQTLVSVD